MTKERLAAFFDAVLAIIMTILVLELEKPSEVSLKGFLALKENFFAYVLSFFWLGTMWVNHHNEWMGIEKISVKTVWTTMLTLFFSSLFPYKNSTFFTSFSFKFSLASFTASFTTSTPITFLKLSEKYILVVPIPEYKSNRFLSLFFPKKSLAILYKFPV